MLSLNVDQRAGGEIWGKELTGLLPISYLLAKRIFLASRSVLPSPSEGVMEEIKVA